MVQFLAFVHAHQAALAAVGSILLQEFIANAPWLKANSIGQLIVGWVQARLSAISGKSTS